MIIIIVPLINGLCPRHCIYQIFNYGSLILTTRRQLSLASFYIKQYGPQVSVFTSYLFPNMNNELFYKTTSSLLDGIDSHLLVCCLHLGSYLELHGVTFKDIIKFKKLKFSTKRRLAYLYRVLDKTGFSFLSTLIPHKRTEVNTHIFYFSIAPSFLQMHTLTHLILKTQAGQDGQYYLHFKDEDKEAEK